MKSTEPVRYIVYVVAKAPVKQHDGASDPDQKRKALLDLARDNQLTVEGVVEEDADSIKQGYRPGLSGIICFVDRGDADGILCDSIQQLGRNAQNRLRIVELFEKGRLRSIRTLTGNFTSASLPLASERSRFGYKVTFGQAAAEDFPG